MKEKNTFGTRRCVLSDAWFRDLSKDSKQKYFFTLRHSPYIFCSIHRAFFVPSEKYFKFCMLRKTSLHARVFGNAAVYLFTWMNVFFKSANNFLHSLKERMIYSFRFRLAEWNSPPFNSWQLSPKCTHKHSGCEYYQGSCCLKSQLKMNQINLYQSI